MLTPVADGPALVVCTTCRHSAEARDGPDGVRGGARLLMALQTVKDREERFARIDIQGMACLFACAEHCAAHIRAPGKIGYILGRFAPDEAAAAALLDYAAHHAASEHGQVAYALWPAGVKGHFIARTPPPGFVAG